MSEYGSEQILPDIPETRLTTVGLVLTSLQLISFLAIFAASYSDLIKNFVDLMILWVVFSIFALCFCVAAALKGTDRRWIFLPLVSQAILFAPFVWLVLALKFS